MKRIVFSNQDLRTMIQSKHVCLPDLNMELEIGEYIECADDKGSVRYYLKAMLPPDDTPIGTFKEVVCDCDHCGQSATPENITIIPKHDGYEFVCNVCLGREAR